MRYFDALTLDNITEADVKLAQESEGLSIPDACPICGSSRLDEDAQQDSFGVHTLTKHVRCTSCNHSWEEEYTITRIRRA